jgi:hypothetical protein
VRTSRGRRVSLGILVRIKIVRPVSLGNLVPSFCTFVQYSARDRRGGAGSVQNMAARNCDIFDEQTVGLILDVLSSSSSSDENEYFLSNSRQIVPKMKKFDKMLSATRVIIENTFGLLKSRFRQLIEVDMHNVNKISKFIISCCVLHNLCIENNDDFDFLMYDEEQNKNEVYEMNVQKNRKLCLKDYEK